MTNYTSVPGQISWAPTEESKLNTNKQVYKFNGRDPNMQNQKLNLLTSPTIHKFESIKILTLIPSSQIIYKFSSWKSNIETFTMYNNL